MIGLQKGTVKLASHIELWHQLFADEEAGLAGAVGQHLIAIEHIGRRTQQERLHSSMRS